MAEPLLIVSVTELNSYRDCRRAWYLSEVRNLKRKVPPMYFWFGDGIHKGMQGFFENGRSVEAAQDAYRKWYIESTDKLGREAGPEWDQDQEYFNAYMMGLTILENYAIFDKETAIQFHEPFEIEQRIRIPILDPQGHETGVLLSGRMDLRCATKDGKGRKVVDHKTAAQHRTGGEVLDIDDQLTGYGYVDYRQHGDLARDFIYDVALKSIPNEPQVNMDGELSKNRNQKTTYYHYMRALTARGKSPLRYAEYLAVLEEKGWDSFFYREITQRNETQMKNYERRLYTISQEMLSIVANPDLAYPSPSPMRCPFCPYLSVCHAMEDGGDAEALAQTRYKVEPREK